MEGIILGCTGIPLLIKQENCDIPVIGTSTTHEEVAFLFSTHRQQNRKKYLCMFVQIEFEAYQLTIVFPTVFHSFLLSSLEMKGMISLGGIEFPKSDSNVLSISVVYADGPIILS